jgi:hypothetical protein
MTNDYRLRYVGSGIFNVNTPRRNNFTEEEEGKVITVKMNNHIFYAFINNETGKSKNIKKGMIVNFIYKPQSIRLKSWDEYSNVTFSPKLLSDNEVQAIKNPQTVTVSNVQAPPPLPTSSKYSIAINDVICGPYEIDQIKQLVQGGSVTKENLAWKEGMSKWVSAGSIPELSEVWKYLPPPLPKTSN